MHRTSSVKLSALALLALSSSMACGTGPTYIEQTELYFALADDRTYTYEAEGGLSETHEYTLREEEDRIFDRVVRRSGFLDDDTTFSLQPTDRALLIVRLHDCVTLCGELSDPIEIAERPLENGASKSTDVTVSVTRNGEDDGTREERHTFAVGEETEVTVPAGTYTAHTILWSRTVDGVASSASLTFAPEEGFVAVESFAGVRYELASVDGLSAD